jgi:hypothetical protein
MAIEAGHPLARVSAALELRDDTWRLMSMALGTLARGLNERGRGLIALQRRPPAADEKRSDNHRHADDDGDKYRSKRHVRQRRPSQGAAQGNSLSSDSSIHTPSMASPGQRAEWRGVGAHGSASTAAFV